MDGILWQNVVLEGRGWKTAEREFMEYGKCRKSNQPSHVGINLK